MIVYGTFTETSIAKLFMAGVIPGLLLTAMFMAYVAVHARCAPRSRRDEAAPSRAATTARRSSTCCPSCC